MSWLKKICVCLLVLGMLAGMCACGGKPTEEEASQRINTEYAGIGEGVEAGEKTNLTSLTEAPAEKRTLTLLLYMIGADLESKTAAATRDIEELTGCALDSEQVNLLVYTGGCLYWHNGVPADTNCLYRYDSAAGEMVMEAKTDGIYSMAAAQTLTDALDHTVNYYPAAHYGLICWDHGTGSVIGYGSDQLFENDSLNLPEFSAALGNSVFGSSEHFDFIGFDACLMGSLETAMAVSPYADYLIASEETEPGAGWDYSVLKGMNGTEGAVQFAQKIIDAFGGLEETYRNSASRAVPDLTLSCMDLSKTDAVVSALNTLCDEIRADENSYATAAKVRNLTKEFAAGYGLDQVDLGHFTQIAEKKWAEPAGALQKAVDEMVVYKTSNVSNTSGLSFYFPYNGQSMYDERGEASLASFYGETGYGAFIKEFLAAKADGQQESHGLGDCEETEDMFRFRLSEADRETLASAYYTVLAKTSDGESYVPILQDMALEPDAEGVLSIPRKQKAIFWTNAEGDKIECPTRMVESADDRTCFSVKIGACTETAFLPFVQDMDCVIRAAVPEGEEKAVIQNILMDSDSAFADRNEVDLGDYAYLKVIYSHGYIPSKNKEGDTLPFSEWERNDSSWFGFCNIGTDYGLVFSELDTTQDDYVIQVTVKDIFGNEFSSDLITPENAALYTVSEQEVTGGTVEYHVYEDHAELYKLKGEITDLTVPANVEGKPVTAVHSRYYNKDAFVSNFNPHLETLTLPDTVTEICDDAFNSCSNLRKVRLPSGLKRIGAHAFAGTRIEQLSLPRSVEYIGPAAFSGCYGYEFNEDFESVYYGIKKVTLPAGLKEIGECAFSGCKVLESIEISGSELYRTENGVLFTADGETLLCYPAGKTDETYTVPESVKRIGTGAFNKAQCREIDVGSVAEIAPYAFYYCDNIKKYTMPDTLEYIGAYAFANEAIFNVVHPDIEQFYIGAGVKKIGEAAFHGARIRTFTVSEENTAFSAMGNMLLDKSKTVLFCVDTADEGTLTIPDGVVTIASHAVDGCSKLTGLVIPDSVINLEFQSFSPAIKKMEIGAGLKNIAAWAISSDTEIVLSPDNPYLKLEDGNLVKNTAE